MDDSASDGGPSGATSGVTGAVSTDGLEADMTALQPLIVKVEGLVASMSLPPPPRFARISDVSPSTSTKSLPATLHTMEDNRAVSSQPGLPCVALGGTNCPANVTPMPDTGSAVTIISKGLCTALGLQIRTAGVTPDTFSNVTGTHFSTIGLTSLKLVLSGTNS